MNEICISKIVFSDRTAATGEKHLSELNTVVCFKNQQDQRSELVFLLTEASLPKPRTQYLFIILEKTYNYYKYKIKLNKPFS